MWTPSDLHQLISSMVGNHLFISDYSRIILESPHFFQMWKPYNNNREGINDRKKWRFKNVLSVINKNN